MKNYHALTSHSREMSLSIGKDSIYGGYSGCNGFGGAADIDGNGDFKIRNMNSTLLYCDPPQMDSQYISLLFKARHYSIPKPEELILSDSLGNSILYFNRYTLIP